MDYLYVKSYIFMVQNSSLELQNCPEAAHVSRTMRRVHQIIAAALNVLQHWTYDNYCQTQTDEVPLEFEAWCSQRANILQFQCWSIELELELLMLVFIRSL